MYNAQVEVELRDTAAPEQAIDALAEHHPATWQSDRGWCGATISLPAESLAQATSAAVALVSAAYGGAPAIACEVMTEDERDAREGWAPTPELLSVTEVAEQLGITRQAVLQRINSGSLPARKVGQGWAIPAGAIVR